MEWIDSFMGLPELPWYAQLLGQGPTYECDVGWALAQQC